AETALTPAARSLAQAVRQVRQQKATAGQYDSEIESRKLELSRAQTDLAKREPLVAEQAIAGEEVRHAQESVHLAHAALAQAERQSLSAHALVDGTPIESNPTVLQAKDAYRDAWIAAQRNAVVAPVTGYVAERSVQLGQHIQAAEALMTVIPLHSLWVGATFKEVQLSNFGRRLLGHRALVDSAPPRIEHRKAAHRRRGSRPARGRRRQPAIHVGQRQR